MHKKHKDGIEYVDPATWSPNSYWHHPVEDIEPLPDDKPNSYREAALQYMEVLANVDIFMTKTKDPRLAWVSVAEFGSRTEPGQHRRPTRRQRGSGDREQG
jgi:hypothetical protein